MQASGRRHLHCGVRFCLGSWGPFLFTLADRKPALVLFVYSLLSFILLTFTIVLVLVAAIGAFGALVPWAKGLMFLSNLLFLIAFILVPFGFDKLDNPCPANQQGGGQCGVR